MVQQKPFGSSAGNPLQKGSEVAPLITVLHRLSYSKYPVAVAAVVVVELILASKPIVAKALSNWVMGLAASNNERNSVP